MAAKRLILELREKLLANQNPTGLWGYQRNQDGIESTCLAMLALRRQKNTEIERAATALLRLQNSNGSWPSFRGDDPEGSWTTALAILSLTAMPFGVEPVAVGIQWLLSARGREANWFWRWKFQIADKSVQFNPAKYGWSWTPSTTSWVIPTALSLVTLQQVRNRGIDRTPAIDERIHTGVSMLFDRMCPGGGWNAGNGVVFGVPYSPYIDATAIALLALVKYERQPGVHASLGWLLSRLPGCPSSYSLAWGILALAAYRNVSAEADEMLGRAMKELTTLVENTGNTDDLCAVAVSILALEAVDGDNVFEVRT